MDKERESPARREDVVRPRVWVSRIGRGVVVDMMMMVVMSLFVLCMYEVALRRRCWNWID